MTKYQISPLANGTRLRTDHNTFSTVIMSYNKGQIVVGDEIWEAPADGSEVKKGDRWLRVLTVDGQPVPTVGWMAITHKGVPICSNPIVIEDGGGEEVPVEVFPESFVLTDSSGKSAEYVFVREL